MTDESPKSPKSSKSTSTMLTVMAVMLVLSGVGLFWVAWRGISILRHEAPPASASSATGYSAAMAEKKDYVGTWVGGHETLTIDPNGHADWSETRRGATESLHGTVSFEKDALVIDAGVTKRRLHIDRPPHQEGPRAVLTLESMDLERQ